MPERVFRERQRIRAILRCEKCARWVAGWIALDGAGRVIDSGGYVLTVGGAICDECAGAVARLDGANYAQVWRLP